ncbi:MAG TPA: hypothetical protein VGO30_11975 [Mycobacterium sp.]|jgi:hypothetical protein|nr:hypothetical protein [Mycobacterium sp.]
MKTSIKYVAPWLAIAAIGGAVGVAPVAVADPGATPIRTSNQTLADPPASPTSAPPYQGANPLVPSDTGAEPFVFVPPGMSLSF